MVLQIETHRALSLFNGVFFAFYESTQISGNLIASLVLTKGSYNKTVIQDEHKVCGAGKKVLLFCVGAGDGVEEEDDAKEQGSCFFACRHDGGGGGSGGGGDDNDDDEKRRNRTRMFLFVHSELMLFKSVVRICLCNVCFFKKKKKKQNNKQTKKKQRMVF